MFKMFGYVVISEHDFKWKSQKFINAKEHMRNVFEHKVLQKEISLLKVQACASDILLKQAKCDDLNTAIDIYQTLYKAQKKIVKLEIQVNTLQVQLNHYKSRVGEL